MAAPAPLARASAYERMRFEALDLEAASPSASSSPGTPPRRADVGGGASAAPHRRRRLPRLPPPHRWLPALRSALHHEPPPLSRDELEAQMEDCARTHTRCSRGAAVVLASVFAPIAVPLTLRPRPPARRRLRAAGDAGPVLGAAAGGWRYLPS
jgi:hypothetical protein